MRTENRHPADWRRRGRRRPRGRGCQWWLLAWLLAVPAAWAQPQRLAAWNFETADWADVDGTPPRSRSGAERVPGFRGHALAIRGMNDRVVYPLTVRRGRAAIQPTAMCLRLWYRPDWSSAGVTNGRGPGEAVQLVTIGDRGARAADGWWSLGISADGTQVQVSSGGDARDVYEAASAPVRFQAGVWSELVVNVFPRRVLLYVDRVPVFNGAAPRLPGPGSAALKQGIVLGNRTGGGQPARGTLADVEIYDGPLERVETDKFGRVISATPATNGAALEVQWRLGRTEVVDLQRAGWPGSNWVTIASGAGLAGYRDGNVEPGRWYQYRVRTNGSPTSLWLRGGLRLPAIEDRGGVTLLVDETLAEGLREETGALERDLIADGWRVLRHAVPRHDDTTWSANTNRIAAIRAQIRRDWESTDHRLKCVYLIGHVAIPYSGMAAEDGHMTAGDNHFGAWPADPYYGDLDGLWTDRAAYPSFLPAPTYDVTLNVPGDGKFDQESVPRNAAGEARLELGVGRVDFANLPAFGRREGSELEWVRQYLQKVRRYRSGSLRAPPRTIVGPYFQSGLDLDALIPAYRTGSRLYGFGPGALFEGDLFRPPTGLAATWGFESSAGHINRARWGSSAEVTTQQLADADASPRVLFAMLMGSWFGDWAVHRDNLLRGILTARDGGLAAFWVRRAEWRFDPLAFGGTLADAQMETANDVIRPDDVIRGTTRTLTILGDPTLRMHFTEPPRDLRGKRTANGVRLTWSGRTEGGLGQLVYRSTSGVGGPYARVTAAPVTTGEYLDGDGTGEATYLVRTAEVVATGSGSFTNLSAGEFWP